MRQKSHLILKKNLNARGMNEQTLRLLESFERVHNSKILTCYYKLNYTITERVSSSSVNEYMLCVDHVCQQAI